MTITSLALDAAPQPVELSFDPQRTAASMRYAFGAGSYMAELLQNARRAGATRVAITLDDKARTIAVEDDGCGIESLDVLLTNKSATGWSQEIVGEESPYGVGFLAAVHGAERVQVLSRGMRLDIVSEQLVTTRMAWSVADTSAPAVGSVVRLDGVHKMPTAASINSLVDGFAIDVVINGQPAARACASDREGFIDSAVGKVRLSPTRPAKRKVRIFVQGAEIHHAHDATGARGPDEADVVHLEPTQFRGMFPDRTRLVDQNEKLPIIFKALDDLAIERLLQAKATLSAEEFCTRFFRYAKAIGRLDVFNDVPLLPAECVVRLDRFPDFTLLGEWSVPSHHLTHHVARQDIENSSVVVLELDPSCAGSIGNILDDLSESVCSAREFFEEDDVAQDKALALLVYGGHCQWLYLKEPLDAGHWIARHLVRLDGAPVEIRPQITKTMTVNDCRTVNVQGLEVCLCDRIELVRDGASVTLRTQFMPAVMDDRLCLCVAAPAAPAASASKEPVFDRDMLEGALLAIKGCSSDNTRDRNRDDLYTDASEVMRVVRNLLADDDPQAIALGLFDLGMRQFHPELSRFTGLTLRLSNGRIVGVEEVQTAA